MSERFFLSEEEIEKRFGKPIAVISEMWTHSDIYYDAENDQFVEERYHEEYLDTGTVCDGCYVISDGYLWKELVRTCNEEGLEAYLNYRGKIPESLDRGKMVTHEEFLEGLSALMENNPKCKYFCKETDSIFVITNETGKVLCKIGKADHYYYLFNPNSDVQKLGFQCLDEAFAKALEKVTSYHNSRPECDCKVNEQKGYHVGKAYEEFFSKANEQVNHPKKKGFFAKLFGKQ